MFTGLITAIGEVKRVTPQGADCRLTLQPSPAYQDLVIGESIAVNGACLSIESFDIHTFTAFASQETLRVTNLAFIVPGHKVNLERALCLGDRLGGHMVSGHVDTLAEIEEISSVGQSRCFRIRFPDAFSKQVIPKGSVTLDGISLTVNNCGAGFLEVNIIPETQGATTISRWSAGYTLNLETDLIGKYVQQSLGALYTAPRTSSGLTVDFLRENNFL